MTPGPTPIIRYPLGFTNYANIDLRTILNRFGFNANEFDLSSLNMNFYKLFDSSLPHGNVEELQIQYVGLSSPAKYTTSFHEPVVASDSGAYQLYAQLLCPLASCRWNVSLSNGEQLSVVTNSNIVATWYNLGEMRMAGGIQPSLAISGQGEVLGVSLLGDRNTTPIPIRISFTEISWTNYAVTLDKPSQNGPVFVTLLDTYSPYWRVANSLATMHLPAVFGQIYSIPFGVTKFTLLFTLEDLYQIVVFQRLFLPLIPVGGIIFPKAYGSLWAGVSKFLRRRRKRWVLADNCESAGMPNFTLDA
jgi:hypothetical protein